MYLVQVLEETYGVFWGHWKKSGSFVKYLLWHHNFFEMEKLYPYQSTITK